MATESIPFGQDQTGRMVDATEVPSGLACQCICPSCKAPLVAKKGEIKRPHFAHQADQSHCTAALESSLHRMAKQIYTELELIRLPGMDVMVTEDIVPGYPHRLRRTVPLTGGIFRFNAVEVEKSYGAVRPDVVLHGATDLMVEVLVTHAVDDHKAALLQVGGHACVELDLGQIDRLTDRASLTQVLKGPAFYRWVHHPRAPEVLNELLARMERELPALRVKERERIEAQEQAKRLDAQRQERFKADRERRRTERAAHEARAARFHRREAEAEDERRSKTFDELYVSQPAGSNPGMHRTMLAVQEDLLINPDVLLSPPAFERFCRDLGWRLRVPGGARSLVLEYLGASTPEEGHARLLQGLVTRVPDLREVVCTNCGTVQVVMILTGRALSEVYTCQDCGELFDAGAQRL